MVTQSHVKVMKVMLFFSALCRHSLSSIGLNVTVSLTNRTFKKCSVTLHTTAFTSAHEDSSLSWKSKHHTHVLPSGASSSLLRN